VRCRCACFNLDLKRQIWLGIRVGVPAASSDRSSAATLSMTELSAVVAALQVELVSVKSHVRESEAQNESLRETIVQLAHENQLLKRRLFGNKTEKTQTSELQLALGSLLDEEKQLQKQLNEAVSNAAAAGKEGDGTPSRPSENFCTTM
jgi:chromosome segregation ATPase